MAKVDEHSRGGISLLIGAHTLEAFLLTVDTVEQKLVPKEAYLMRANRGR